MLQSAFATIQLAGPIASLQWLALDLLCLVYEEGKAIIYDTSKAKETARFECLKDVVHSYLIGEVLILQNKFGVFGMYHLTSTLITLQSLFETHCVVFAKFDTMDAALVYSTDEELLRLH
jgi:hypothetical protein